MIAQYANSPVLVSLDNGLKTLFDDSPFITNWYNVIFNLKTATGYGLDVWGKILNRSREFVYNGVLYNLKGAQTIDGVSFTEEGMDNLYRLVLQMVAMRYIGNASINSINKILSVVFEKYGRAYCIEYGTMQIRYVIEFYASSVLKAIIEELNLHPTGVLTSYEYLPRGRFLGFYTGGNDEPYTPFDNGPFYR